MTKKGLEDKPRPKKSGGFCLTWISVMRKVLKTITQTDVSGVDRLEEPTTNISEIRQKDEIKLYLY